MTQAYIPSDFKIAIFDLELKQKALKQDQADEQTILLIGSYDPLDSMVPDMSIAHRNDF